MSIEAMYEKISERVGKPLKKSNNAKEIFEELGYTQIINDNKYIEYKYTSWLDKKFYYNIRFDKKHKEIKVKRHTGFIRRFYSKEDLIGFYLSDIQAINKQLEELGWNNE